MAACKHIWKILLLINLQQVLIKGFNYDMGTSFGDIKLPRWDDGTKVMSTTDIYNYFGNSYSDIHISMNGVISFGADFPWSDPEPFPITDGGADLIATFWADFDPSNKGKVFYRETNDPVVLDDAKLKIDSNFVGCSESFTPTNALVITWKSVTYFHEEDRKADVCVWEDPITNTCISLSSRRRDIEDEEIEEQARSRLSRAVSPPRNTVQAVLLTDSVNTYLMFNYPTLEWSTGDFSDGVDGMGGNIARVGFNNADGTKHYNHKFSGKAKIWRMRKRSNMGIKGTWIYRIHGTDIVDAKCNTLT